jgi:crotonobetainyl-CoA:carnitine CoA-transferase CaiB-like acyl-CoA transferase
VSSISPAAKAEKASGNPQVQGRSRQAVWEPTLGADTRYISVGPEAGMSGVFVNVNRGKRSVVLDLRSNAGKDVFIHSMHAKAIARLGFSYDKVAGLTALYATTMELFHRERTGEGQEVEVAMFETMASFMLVEHANGAMFDPAMGPAIYPRTVAPNRRPYRTSDSYIAVLIYNDRHWSAFVNAVQPPFDNPHLSEIGFFETLNTPHGPVRFPGVPTWFSRTAGRVAGPAPQLGADTAEVLDELGLGADAAQGLA